MKNIITLLCCLLLSAHVRAAANPGTTSLNFLKIEVGAKAQGMAGAFSAISDDGSAVYWNPAGLAQQRHSQVSLMHVSWFEGVNYQFGSFIQPAGKKGTFGASLYYLSSGDIDSYDNAGTKLNTTLKASDFAFALSYGKKYSVADAGVTVKIVQERLGDLTVAAYAFDAGLIRELDTSFARKFFKDAIGRTFKIAVSAQNIGPEVVFIEKKDALPANYRLGFSQDFFHETLVTACDINLPKDDDMIVNAGLDYRITDWVSVRAGYRFRSYRPQYDIQPGFMGGFGLGNEYVSIDYAFVPYSVLGNTHRIGLNYRFGKNYSDTLIETKLHQELRYAKKSYRKKELVEAYYAFKNVLAIDPLNTEALEYARSIESKINEIKTEAYIEQAKRYLTRDKLFEAKEISDKILALFPQNKEVVEFSQRIETVFQQQKTMRVEAMVHQALEFYQSGNYADAISLWEKVLLIVPDHAKSQEYIGLAKSDIAKLDQQKKDAEHKKNLQRSEELFAKGKALFDRREWLKAKSLFEESLALNQENIQTAEYIRNCALKAAQEHFAWGTQKYKEGDLGGAIESWEKALEFDATNKAVMDALNGARNERTAARKEQAAQLNNDALKEYGVGNIEQATQLWEKALALDPENVKMRNNYTRAKEELEKRK